MALVPLHGRDHCPGGPDPMPCLAGSDPWVILRDGTADVPNASTNFPVPFAFAQKNFDPDDAYFTWTITDTGDTGNDRFEVTLVQEGLYHVELAINWNDTGTGNGTSRLDLNPSDVYNPLGAGVTELNAFQAGADWVTTGGSGDIQASAIQRVAGILSADANCILQPTVNQTTGGTRGLTGIHLKAIYLGSHGPSDDWIAESI